MRHRLHNFQTNSGSSSTECTSGNQKNLPNVFANGRATLMSVFRRISHQPSKANPDDKSLPNHCNDLDSTSPTPIPNSTTTTNLWYMLICMETNRDGVKMNHERIDHIQKDRRLFLSMRDLYRRKRNYIRTLISMRTLISINLTKVSQPPHISHVKLTSWQVRSRYE